jgi:hypothetical protein
MSLRVEDYEKVTKPKVTAPKSNQEVFDFIVRKLVQQEVPCIKLYEKIHKDDPDPSKMAAADIWEAVTFNCSGHRSPILSFCTIEDMRHLKLEIGYENLQYMSAVSMEYLNRGTLRDTDASFKKAMTLSDVWTKRGVINYDARKILIELEDLHDRWARDCAYLMESMNPVTRTANLIVLKRELHYYLNRMANTFSLNREVLKFAAP